MSNYSDDVRSFDSNPNSPFYDDGGRDEAIEEKAGEVKETLLSVSHKYEEAFVIDAQSNRIDLSDFIAEMQVNDGLFAEFLDGGDLLKDKLDEQLDEYCTAIATGLIDNEEPPECDYDTREEYDGDM